MAEDINSIANGVIDLQEGDALRQEEIMALDERVTVLETSGGGNITVDQTYDPTSENAQSGKAVAEAIEQNTETWELVEEIVLTEDTANIERYTDLNGKSYKFKKVLIQAVASTTENSSAYFSFKKSNTGVILPTLAQGTIFVNNSNRSAVFTVERIAGVMLTNFVFSTGSAWSEKASGLGFPCNINEYINFLQIKAHTGSFLAGSTFKIYGVRA